MAGRYCENRLTIIRDGAYSRLGFCEAHHTWLLALGMCSSSGISYEPRMMFTYTPFRAKVLNSYSLLNLRLLRTWLCFSEVFCLALSILSLKLRNSAYPSRGKLRLSGLSLCNFLFFQILAPKVLSVLADRTAPVVFSAVKLLETLQASLPLSQGPLPRSSASYPVVRISKYAQGKLAERWLSSCTSLH